MPRRRDEAMTNPFRPGAGHMPPYLAGRTEEADEFQKLLKQNPVLQNVVLTGLRGVGKTVLLETFKPEATRAGWLWAGTDLSESASIDEKSLALRLLTDLSVVTAGVIVAEETTPRFGFDRSVDKRPVRLDYATLTAIYESTPGLVSDKLKEVLEITWRALSARGARGVIFAYDEAQNLADRTEKDEYPLSVLLDVFQSLQKKGAMFMLVLTGLPTLFPKLVAARTYAERMFRIIMLDRLGKQDCRDAISKPVADSPYRFTKKSVELIAETSGGYPYFVQFICREVYDVWAQQVAGGTELSVPVDEIQRKLDTDFFAGRWSRVTDRQRELLMVVSSLETAESEFTVLEIVEASRAELEKPFSASHVSQMLNSLSDAGLIYKNRHGKYSLAVPLLNRFIRRQMKS